MAHKLKRSTTKDSRRSQFVKKPQRERRPGALVRIKPGGHEREEERKTD